MIVTGTYDLVANPQWRQLQLQDVYLDCDTQNGQVVINLFEINELNRFWNVRLFISDFGNNASINNIIINAGGSDTLDDSSTVQIVLNIDGESIIIQPVSENKWIGLESVGGAGVTPTLQQVLDNNHDLLDGNNFQGTKAGLNNTGVNVNFQGTGAGLNNSGSNVNAFGESACEANSNDNVNAFGSFAGFSNSGKENNFFGLGAGQENTESNVHAFGSNAGRQNTGRHAVFLGRDAGYDSGTDIGNSLSSVFVINNAILPEFPDIATAQATISVGTGAVAGNTYLYYNSSKKSIEAVRL